MVLLSSSDVAIKLAILTGTLRVSQHTGRDGRGYYAICDDRGLIEVAMSAAECEARVGTHFGQFMSAAS